MSMETVTVRDVMEPMTEFIEATQSVGVARQRMQGVEAIRSLLVVDGAGRLVGAVRYGDIGQDTDATMTVGDLAMADVPVARVDQPLQELEGLMTESGLDRLPVVDESGTVIGELPRGKLTNAEHAAEGASRIRPLLDAKQADTISRELGVERDMTVNGREGGKIGTVKEVLVDALNGDLTHIVVHTGLIFGKDHAVPADLIDRVEDGHVVLKVDKEDVTVLPDLNAAP